MAFNHYAKIKQILARVTNGWYVKRIHKPTQSKSFKGETIHHTHYYRIYTADHQEIKFCKLQKLDRFLSIMSISEDEILIVE